VWKVDRLGRDFFHLVELEHRLTRRGVKIVSVVEAVDTSTRPGRMAYRFLAIFADEEHAGMVTRTVAGVASAKARGKKPGRRPKLTPKQVAEIEVLLDGDASADDVAKLYGVDRSTIYRHGTQRKIRENPPSDDTSHRNVSSHVL
jgi:DNA invertase Pin-like site-specific DNA recombinase